LIFILHFKTLISRKSAYKVLKIFELHKEEKGTEQSG